MFVAVLLAVVIVVLAFVVDLGYAWVVRGQLRNAADAGAHAAVAELDGTAAGVAAARATAITWAARNVAGGEAVSLAPSDVRFGAWDLDAGAFVVLVDPRDISAVAVTARGSAPAFFAPVAFGIDSFDATVTSTVQGGSVGRVGCYLPLAVPSCLITAGDGICNQTLTFHPTAQKNVAWARVGSTGSVTATWVNDQLRSCTDEDAEVGETLQMSNGTMATSVSVLADQIASGTRLWDTSEWGAQPARMSDSAVSTADYGHVVSGPVVVFESSNCAGGPYATSSTVSGFAWAVVYDARVGADASIAARILCDEEDGPIPGGIAGTGYPASPWFRE